ncbi:MAG: primosomal protein N' [Gemmatimonadota bacterium]|nr:primosomal protein N' [Gemmatimonadota bacterium]MDE2870639.1 primosomal protein N' [Gemmatimonadota bacterium]
MSLSPGSLVEVALPVPLRQCFNYRLDAPVPEAGTRVRVPFRDRMLVGWVLGPGSEVPGLKDVVAVLEDRPSVGGELLDLARWIAEYYVVPLGLVLRAMLPVRMTNPAATEPAPARRAVARVVRSIGTLEELQRIFGRAKRQREAYEYLLRTGGRQPLAALLEAGFRRPVVRGLEDKGLVALAKEVVARDPFRDERTAAEPVHTPTPGQRRVLNRLERALGDGGGTLLLHGVTGSGKTLVYIELIRRVLGRGRGAIVLVPEIALTPQTVGRFRRAFGDLVAVLHSGLSHGERYDAWRLLRSGTKRIAIGARSAVFAPVPAPGAIVVDEEHDGSYKQSETPRYSARDVAVVRARSAGAVCLLGSATPSLESWLNARSGKYGLVELPDRVGGGVLPEVRVVDLRTPPAAGPPEASGAAPVTGSRRGGAPAGGGPKPPASPMQVLSPRLADAARRRLSRREQTILLLNRRGYATFALCESCGLVSECAHCSVSMTLHRALNRMICHHCGHTETPPEHCGRCGSRDIAYGGLGTEQVERVVVESFPGARIARMDMDTTRGKWSHRDILERVRRGEVDILLGTQMIAKGLDFPRVTLVGVINADTGLHLPDFRSCERTFQLLSQVAGRAGRGRLPGQVIIQTYVPDHYAVRAAVAHDYRGFVERELRVRTDPPFPPHLRMARIVLSSPAQDDTLAAAESLGSWLESRGRPGVEVLGPAPAPIERLHGRFRWHFLLRGSTRGVGRVLEAVASGFQPAGTDIRVSLDRDPLHLM